MTGPFNLNNDKNQDQEQNQQQEQQCFSRSDVATTRRAIQDLKNQADKLKRSINNSMSEANTVSLDEFKSSWDKREALNKVNKKVDELGGTLSDMMPSLSKARLSDEERTQIKGLYNSKLYTQKQLAEQYGVSQPTVGEVVKKGS